MDVSLPSDKIKKIDKIRDGLSYSIGEPDVSLNQLMNDKFILENTNFQSWESLLRAAAVKTEADLEKPHFNEFIRLHTRFDDWEIMLIHSANEYAARHQDG
jgi:hypothetical protein